MLRRQVVHAFLPAAVLFAATAALVPERDRQRAAADLEGTIGIVHLDAVSEGYPGTDSRNAEYQALEDQARQELTELERAIQEQQSKQAANEEGTDAYAVASMELDALRYRAQQTAQLWENRLERLRLRLANELFEEIQRGVSAFAKDRGLAMVFRVTPESSNPRSRQQAQRRREMLYHDAALDVTEACRAYLKAWNEDGE